jgi:hypothetical protein
MSWESFKANSESYSVALDGYVGEGPTDVDFSNNGPRQNFNHHEGVCRLATLATCQQVLLAVRMGFFNAFRTKEDGKKVNIYHNDCDEDVCASIFCLTQSHLVEGVINPAINRYMHVTGVMDATGGAYPFPVDLKILEEHTWTVQPYLRFRATGGLDKRNAEDFSIVVDEVCGRILKHILGQGKSVSLDTEYEVLHSGNGWSLVKEIGSRARLSMFEDGIRAYVSIFERPDGNLRVTVGKFSGYIPFNVPRILEGYNAAEGLGIGDDRAGGSDLVGGTSRKNGTKLSIEELIKVTESEK